MVRGLGFERHVSGRVCVTVCVSMCDTLPRVNTVYNSAKHDLSFLYSIIACVPFLGPLGPSQTLGIARFFGICRAR